jgi:hypothetical protein
MSVSALIGSLLMRDLAAPPTFDGGTNAQNYGSGACQRSMSYGLAHIPWCAYALSLDQDNCQPSQASSREKFHVLVY